MSFAGLVKGLGGVFSSFLSVRAATRSVSSGDRSSLVSSFFTGGFAMTSKDPLDPNPFAKPCLTKKGDANARDIYTSVGFALDRWEHCEISFATIYSALVAPDGETHALMRAYGTIMAPATRKDMMWEANDAYFGTHKNDELKAKTRHMLNLYKDAAARRNEIAHGIVSGQDKVVVVGNKGKLLNTEWFLRPSLFSTRKTELFYNGEKYRYGSKDIDHFSHCFQTLSDRAMKLKQSIREFYASLPEKPGKQ